MTSSLTKKGEIIFESNKYMLKSDNKVHILEEIANKVISGNSDLLAKQYENYTPFFPKSNN